MGWLFSLCIREIRIVSEDVLSYCRLLMMIMIFLLLVVVFFRLFVRSLVI